MKRFSRKKKLTNLDSFIKMSLQYHCYETNYKEPLNKNIVAFALKITKLPAIQPISTDFSN